ncbi:uncharacterized protein [Haliotis cracherodii]|uniref:uncharacterized protein n=1 Tax=Haliotis cracherodii TaxID=6455 RepID=UPI0039EA1742
MDPFPVCVVCRTAFRYRGLQPHLLPCLHPVCQDCLKSPEVTALDCSICSKSYDICDTDRQFPVDEVVLAEVLHLTSKHRPAEFLCTNDEDGNQAVCWCGECGDFLCEHCQVLHTGIKATRSHKTTLIPDLSEKVKGSQLECEKHGHCLDIFDDDCDCFICFRCFYEDHVGHSTTKADTFLTTEEQQLNNCLKSATCKKEKLDSATNDVNEQTRIIQQKAVSLRETVQHTFAELKTLIDQREKEMLVELDHLLDSMRNINDSRRPILKSSETICQSLLDYINKTLLYASPSHLHKLKSSITQAFETCLKLDVPLVHGHESSVLFSKQGLQDMKSLISRFGSFFATVKDEDQVTELSSFHSDRQLCLESTIAELRDQKIRLVKEIGELKNEVRESVQVVNDLDEDVSRLTSFVVQMDPDGGHRGVFLHVVRGIQNEINVVKCPKMMFDTGRVSTKGVHINDKGVLVNHEKPGGGRPSDWTRKRFQNYHGTSSAFPLPSSGLVYWEVEALVELDKPLGGRSLILEVGVCGEEAMDNAPCVGGQPNSCCLSLAHNDLDNTVGLNIMQNGQFQVFMQNRLDNKAGVFEKLKYGVLISVDRRTVNFIDINRQRMWAAGCLVGLKHSARMWPVFGVFSGSTRVAMRLVSGGDVQMEVWKKTLIGQTQSHYN